MRRLDLLRGHPLAVAAEEVARLPTAEEQFLRHLYSRASFRILRLSWTGDQRHRRWPEAEV